jgi:hypothetical protein
MSFNKRALKYSVRCLIEILLADIKAITMIQLTDVFCALLVYDWASNI